MTLNRVNLALLFALMVVLVLLALTRVNHSLPNYQIIMGDDMTYSPAYTAFEPNDNFPNGRTIQSPVPGTIPWGSEAFHFEATPQGALLAGEQLANPFESESEQVAASSDRGEAVFKSYCIACHGADGSGNGLVAKRGFPPPPSLLTGKSREMKDGQLMHILTYGQNSMPQFAAQLSASRRWDVINYIRGLQQQSPPPSTDPMPSNSKQAPAEPESEDTESNE